MHDPRALAAWLTAAKGQSELIVVRCRRVRLNVGLSRELSPLRGKAKPFFIVGAECFIGHSATNVGLLAIMGGQRVGTDWDSG
jgi:hypothetical protein